MKIIANRTVKANAEQLWPYVSDFSGIYRFHPLVKDSQTIGDSDEPQIGSRRECIFKNGGYSKEEVTAWNEGCSYTVKIYETSLPIKRAEATLGVLPMENGDSQLFMHMDLKPKNKIMAPIMFLMFRFGIAPRILKDLDQLFKLESSSTLQPV